MSQFDRCCRKYLVELWDKRDQFRGNGGIIVYPNGSRYLATASHVVFINGDTRCPRVLEARNISDRTVFPYYKLLFANRLDRDIAEAPLDPGLGIPVAEMTDLSETHEVHGSIGGDEFGVWIKPILFQGQRVESIPCPRISLSRDNLTYELSYGMELVPGSSGALILNNDYKVVGVNSGRFLGAYWGELLPLDGRLLATV